MITGDHLEYLIGVLNSKIFDFYFRLISSGLSGQASRGFKAFIERFPVPDPADPSIRNQIGKLALQIVDIKKNHEYDKNTELQSQEVEISEQINQLVYKIYGLNKTEVSLVEREVAK
jgi:ankyrin repeat protein